MKRRSKLLLAGMAVMATSYHVLIGWTPAPAETQPAAAGAAPAADVRVNPERDAYFGDLHLHTTNSMDAYSCGVPKPRPTRPISSRVGTA